VRVINLGGSWEEVSKGGAVVQSVISLLGPRLVLCLFYTAMPHSASSSVSSAKEAVQQTLTELRISIDSDKVSPIRNGAVAKDASRSSATTDSSPRSSSEVRTVGSDDGTHDLQSELDRCRQEKEALRTQYQNLVSRLNNMRTTLGNKLKQDGVRGAAPFSAVIAIVIHTDIVLYYAVLC
jgi:hypothetical protein